MAYAIAIKQGDLFSEKSATFIVNPSNTTLTLGSGVSMSFRHHCGAELQIEMHNQLKDSCVKLQKGDVVLTSTYGASQFKYALHVAIMDYSNGLSSPSKNPTKDDILKALQNIEKHLLNFSDSETSLKMILPLMGCGVGSLPKKEVIEIYKNFFCRLTEIDCEIVIYGYSEEDFNLLSDIFYLTAQ